MVRLRIHSVRSEMFIDSRETNYQIRSKERNGCWSIYALREPDRIWSSIYKHLTPNGVKPVDRRFLFPDIG